jgi:two-component system sensor histidine kinase HydH
VADIDDEVTRLNRIVNEVLDFSRPIKFDLAPADIAALCRESAAAAQATPGAAVALDLDPALPMLVTDAERLRIALVNMLVNARHAVNGDNPPVILKATAAGGRVTITITDRGAGVAPADVAHIFDPYFTTKRGGTGLGLPIARNIVEGLGGTITVLSSIDPGGHGTEIRIDLPTLSIPSGSRASGAA